MNAPKTMTSARRQTPRGIGSSPTAAPSTRCVGARFLAIVRAARVVFGRDGYSRSSIDAIAAEAAVSTRTIYNHFDGKEQLFAHVLLGSATQVADAFSDAIGGLPSELADARSLQDRLIAVGHALAEQRVRFPEHFAMVRQISAEAPHFPPDVLDAWQDAGPGRVQHELTQHLQNLAGQGLLRLPDAQRAAVHLTALTTAEITSRSFAGAFPLDARATDEIVRAGVQAFLTGYAAAPARRQRGD